MPKFLRVWLSILLSVLALLSSSGTSEALHESLHALLSSKCAQDAILGDALPAQVKTTTLTSVVAPCPIQLIVQASLGHSAILPATPASVPSSTSVTPAVFDFRSADFESWLVGWMFSRGPPVLA